MAYKIRWAPEAIEAFENICQRIEQDSSFYASVFADGVYELINIAAQQPDAGREVPEYNNPDIREFFYKSYRVIYRKRIDIIEVTTIFHGARILPDMPL
jgi:plasmid stabilization system protein ParE